MTEPRSYRAAGVDIDAGERTVDLMKDAVRRTYGPAVLAGIGSFGGLYDASALLAYRRPVLVTSTDGVGTKTKVATKLGRLGGLGFDIVNHCVNDILVQGAEPLLFLDYVATSRLEPERVAAIVRSIAAACEAQGIPLMGGETAEMPGVYVEGELDLVGTIVGVVEYDRIVTGETVQGGDVILALESGGLQTNGFSLARSVLDGRLDEPLGDRTVGEALLVPHRSYRAAVRPALEAGLVRGMAHVTGGGIPGNLPRVLPAGLGARIERGSWPVPAVFERIAREGVDDAEMFRAFNMGAGFLMIVRPEDEDACRSACGEPLHRIGSVVAGHGVEIG